MKTMPPELPDRSPQPGFHERCLWLRHDNVYFPPERRTISPAELETARALDAEIFASFVHSYALASAILDQTSPSSVTGGILREVNDTITHGCGIGASAEKLVESLRAKEVEVLQWQVNKVLRTGSDEEKATWTAWLEKAAALYRLWRNPAYVEFMFGDEMDRLPALLSTDVSYLRCLFEETQKLPADTGMAEAWESMKTELARFALELIRHSPEARAKLSRDPEKVALLGVSLEASAASGTRTCAHCGHRNDDAWKFCGECGTPQK